MPDRMRRGLKHELQSEHSGGIVMESYWVAGEGIGDLVAAALRWASGCATCTVLIKISST